MNASDQAAKLLQSQTDFALAQALECAVAQLAHALAGDAEHGADLLEGVLATAVETEVEAEHFRVAGGKRGERALDLLAHEPIHVLVFRIRSLLGHEALDERAVAVGVERSVEANVSAVECRKCLHDFDGESGELRQLLGHWLAAELLTKDLRALDDAREIGCAVERHANGAPLLRKRRENRLANPPDGVGDELHALIGIELPRGGEEADVAFADEIDERHAAILIFLRDGDDEAEIALDELLERVLIAGADESSEIEFLRALE